MSIEVIYDKFSTINDQGQKEIKELMSRDSSWGTFTKDLPAALKTCGENSVKRWKKFQPAINNLNSGRPEDERFSLTFPKSNFNFESESIDHFIGVVAGDIILNPRINSIRVADFNFKDNSYLEYFPGPNIGIENLYNDFLSGTLNGLKRPILAFTIKPRIGHTVEDLKKLYIAAASSGVDIIEDDERIIDPPNCPFYDRVTQIADLQKQFDSIYSVNITGDSLSALSKLDFCAEHGIKMVKIDVLVSGFETLRKVSLKIKNQYASRMAITVYPDAYGAFRNLGRKFILKLCRLCGADIIYAGSPNWARYVKEEGELETTIEPIFQRHRELSEQITYLDHIKPTLPTITNDQHPSRAELLTVYFRKFKDVHYKYAYFVGGGISSFPSNIKIASYEWINCLKHASTAEIKPYTQYDFSNYEKEFDKMDWDQYDVERVINE